VIERNWNELIRPEKPAIELGIDPSRKARLVAEPLERGFGVTLGNSLRRVLLSSLQGAAVTAVQIDGVVHEFSSLEGVREDVVDIVLNIKQLALRLHADGVRRMTLRAQGPGAVTARQIEAARRALTRHMKRQGRVWIRIFPDVPVTAKPVEVRMGKGKGSVEYWACKVKPGRIMFEIDGVGEVVAREALRLGAMKLPVLTRVVIREDW
jgi:ribosomal protein L16